MADDRLIKDPPAGLRQHRGVEGWRLWWEPSAKGRKVGMRHAQLDAGKLTWSVRRANEMSKIQAKRISEGPRTPQHTVEDLVQAFIERSDYETRFSPQTRANNDALFARIRAEWGADSVKAVSKPRVYHWFSRVSEANGAPIARNLVMKLSALMQHAERLGWRGENSNPCRGLDVPVCSRRNRIGSHDQLTTLIDTAMAEDRPMMAAAIALAAYTGQRQGDLLAAKHADIRGNVWHLRRQKNGTASPVFIHDAARPWLNRARQASLRVQAPTILIDDRTDRPWNQDTFGKVYRQIRDTAKATMPKIDGLQFRDLRRTAGAAARRGGADAHDVGQLLGNSAGIDPALAETYMPGEIETARRTVEGMKW